ncbi:hypothetical protein GCM10010156_56630 [Planobispora rosea]|uniref:Glycosyltransferase RgtA/B/C/D-like domain-containing protein n=1 Tax=Planobispora rosea TaxID=35762 RepID=A0A8J3S8E3_PLARO|nr:hypothetical protein [Planobispora rosea]GGS90986.1 hypothetical protein GCM10010156_56630 [Planobispora rosea]GIH86889.1 hypothetical protein Pro02_52970 [Planobispora rosea]
MRRLIPHRLFIAVLTVAAVFRVLTMIGYSPAVWFEDSFDYVGVAERMQPYPVRPSGYSFLLWALRPLHSFAAVTAVQHLMGLATGVMIYVLIRRRVSALSHRWAALAAAPALLDAYQIFFEHTVLSDVLFSFLVTAAVTLALWSPEISLRRAALAGLLLAAATLTRSVGLVLLPLLACHFLINRSGRRAVTAALVAAVLPLGGYALWYGSWHGSPAITGGSGVWLWARVMPFADCQKIGPPPDEAVLCPPQPRERRPTSPFFIWADWSPLREVPGHPVTTHADLFHPEIDGRAGALARRAVAGQPLDYLGLADWDLGRTLAWSRGPNPAPVVYNRYVFPNVTGPLPDGVRIAGGTIQQDLRAYERGPAATRFREPFAGIMRAYQSFVFLPGTVFGVLLIHTVVRAVRSRRRTHRVVFLPLVMGVALTVTPVLVTSYDSRYWLPAIPLLSMALALTWSRPPGVPSAAVPQAAGTPGGRRRNRRLDLKIG